MFQGTRKLALEMRLTDLMIPGYDDDIESSKGESDQTIRTVPRKRGFGMVEKEKTGKISMTNQTKQRNHVMDRREFCGKIPCAAAGLLALSPLLGDKTARKLISGELERSTEEKMAKTITLKVISQEGTCAAGHKVGDTIVITENEVKGKICIHALYAILPKVFAMMFDAQFPWLEDPDVSTSACPDAYNPVVFEISRKKAD